MEKIVNEFKNIKGAKYQRAPPKLGERAVIKAQTDYGSKRYPSAANIVDYCRLSVTFNNAADLLRGVQQFEETVNNNNAGCIKKIVRIKNKFQDIQQWSSMFDYGYVDLKFNVIIENENQTKAMIVEIQYLLSFLLTAKKLGHKLYSV